jgi:hypothetical protein
MRFTSIIMLTYNYILSQKTILSSQQLWYITFLTVFILTHPVDFPRGRKPGHPEKTNDFRQSVD